ncbi:hypothetical protein Sjap_001593 [Stephania japonica]|uniref:Importin subunit alpha n=1 Tax=Stephania japonica TaxID=461633 RepID=A0AAP0KLS0_9MAGN
MADEGFTSHRRDPVKSSVGNAAASRRRQLAVTVGKERREALFRAKRLCRDAIVGSDGEVVEDKEMVIDEGDAASNKRTSDAVQELTAAFLYQGKGAMQKKVQALQNLRRILSNSDVPPVEACVQAGAVPILTQCLSFGSPDEQLLEAAWCLTNIAAGEPEQTKALLPALPLLIAHVGDKSTLAVAEQCTWALGNVAGEGEDMRNILLAQGALPPLARMMLSNKGSTARTAAWALSNLIKGPDPKAANELIRIDGVLGAIVRHLGKADEELATEVAWVAVYLSALSNMAIDMLLKSDAVLILVERLETSNHLQLLIPEAAWVLSNIGAGSLAHKQLIYSSEAVPLLLRLLSTAPFDIRKEVAYALGNLCVAPADGPGQPKVILEHLISLVGRGCLSGFVNLVRSADVEAAKLGLQFCGAGKLIRVLVMRGMPNSEGPKLVEKEDGIDAMERFQFHENEDLRNMANGLVDKYFGEDYGLDE